jgi:hypothetical protein
MKKLLLAAAITGVTAACFGQGAVDFGNDGLTVNVDLGTSSTHSTALAPAGSFDVALYWSSAGISGMTTANSILLASGLGLPAGGGIPGVFENGPVTNAVFNATTPAGFIVEATGIGAIAGYTGQTPAFLSPVANETSQPPGTPPFLTGWTSDLILAPTPEPATLAVAGLGAASLLLFRRKK